jgi:hypothetical protein
VIGSKSKLYWIEFQLLDEQGEPLANMPYRAVNEAGRAANRRVDIRLVPQEGACES